MKTTDATSKSVGDALLKIMEQGSQDFMKATGRNMTYADMRHMYG